MKIAILITNTDESAFARARPDDGEKFRALFNEVRPDWQIVPHWICRNEFPGKIETYDGVVITGSPASVNEEAAWMKRLEGLVLEMIELRLPLFAACFGHQLVAKALGADIVRNRSGWGHGLIEVRRSRDTPWAGPQERLMMYGSHIEQVGSIPPGARCVFESDGVPVAGFAVGDHLFTVQHHPEMTHEFISDLVDYYASYVGDMVTEKARRSLERRADSGVFAEEIAGFFEYAAKQR